MHLHSYKPATILSFLLYMQLIPTSATFSLYHLLIVQPTTPVPPLILVRGTPSLSIKRVIFLVCPSFILSFRLGFPLSATLSNQGCSQWSGFRAFVFFFSLHSISAFYYRLVLRLLTQTWLPLLKFAGDVIQISQMKSFKDLVGKRS